MSDFNPTYLYIKKHPITGMMYFGKTCLSDVYKYKGSGRHWKRHLKLHGSENIQTVWNRLFTDKDDCEEFAIFVSEEMDIVKSKFWANEKIENGLDGNPKGFEIWNKGIKCGPLSKERKENISKAKAGKKRKPLSLEVKLKISASNKGKPSKLKGVQRTLETKKLMSDAKKKQWSNPEFREYMKQCRIAKSNLHKGPTN